MNYPALSELGDHYDHEENTEGVRVAALRQLETRLKKAIVDLANAVKNPSRPLPVAPTANTPVAVMVAKHATMQQASNPNARITELRGNVERLKKWLMLQNCTLGSDGSIDWGFSKQTVHYDHQLAEQGLTRVRTQGGRLFMDDLCKVPLDTGSMVTHFSGPGYAIFVMSATGNIHVSSHSVGQKHHSSLLAGGNVAGAGELKCSNGFLQWVSNKSGHYAPSVAHLLQVLHQLQKLAVPMTFPVMVMPEKKEYPSVGAFLEDLELKDEPDYEINKLMAYSDHLTETILATHTPNPWRWREPPEAVGVYDETNDVFIPHKTVRQWLKSTGRVAKTAVQSGSGR